MSKITLADISTRAPKKADKSEIEKETEKYCDLVGDLQHTLYAEKKQSLLVILQGMDASGKDGTTQKVFSDCTPGAVHVYSFKKPTELELSHDFLWRVHQQVPQKGYIQVFNRSHYEDILIQRVHKWIDDKQVKRRMAAINAFEQLLLHDNRTQILKFYLHISPERQLGKLQERIDDPKQNWKHNQGDWNEREYWDDYMKAYEYAINESEIPWHVIPADQRWYRNYAVARVVAEKLAAMDPQLPRLHKEEQRT